MSNFFHSIDYMDTLLGSHFSELLSEIPGSAAIIQKKLEENKHLFQKKIVALGLSDPTPENIHEALQLKLNSFEETLQTRFTPQSLATRTGIAAITDYAYHICAEHTSNGCYMKNSAAKNLLDKLPPKNLLAFINTHTHSIITGTDTPLNHAEMLAMTRHTESTEWQLAYNEHLANLTPDDFEQRPLKVIILDTKKLQPLLDLSRQHQKPWRISHDKETGIITCFMLDNYETYPMPVLLYLAVFMHYFFETSYGGLFFEHTRTQSPETFSDCIRKIIKTGTNKLPFFHPNAYSENLFWKKAIQLLNSSHPHDSLSYFADTLTCGEKISSESESPLISLNIVDHIWSANFSKKVSAEAYFKLTNRDYLYHFREGLWYELFGDILKITENQMDAATVQHLDIGDTDFTDLLIKKYSTHL